MDKSNGPDLEFEFSFVVRLFQAAEQFFTKISDRFLPIFNSGSRVFHRCRQVIASVQEWLQIRKWVEVSRNIVSIRSDDHVLEFREVSQESFKSRTIQGVNAGTDSPWLFPADEPLDISQNGLLIAVRNADPVVALLAENNVDSDGPCRVDPRVKSRQNGLDDRPLFGRFLAPHLHDGFEIRFQFARAGQHDRHCWNGFLSGCRANSSKQANSG